MFVMKNKFAKPCNVCGKTVQPFFGYAAKINGIWKTCCKSVHCAKELGIKEELEKPEAKCIMLNEQTNQFEIEFAYSKEKVALVKGMPGARWNPSMSKWTVPNDPQHLERIAQVATEMGFELPSILVKAKEAPESVLSEDVQRLIETAKAKGAFDYQLEGVRYLSSHTKALMGDDMGLGKTVQVLLSLPVDRGTLVVAPKAVLSNWRAECRRWRPDISPVIATGDELPVPGPRELVIVNYDNPKFRDFSGDINAFKGITLVADEAHLLKGSPYRETVDSKTGKIKKSGVLRVSAFMRFRDVAGQVWGLTGTPLANKPIDLWGVLSSLDMNKDVFGSWGGFTRCFNGYKGRFGWTFGGPTADVPERMRRVMIRRTKSEVLPELPGKVYTDLEVELSPELIADLDILSDEWGDYIAETHELPDFAEFSQVRAKLASDRIPAMLEQVELFEEQETPLVVFSAHRAPIDTLGKRKGWEVITGSTSTEERGRIVEAFQRGELKGVGLTIAAGGVGLTLTAASYMLFVDLAWRPSDNAQAEDRICRIGQKAKSCNIIRMVSTHPLDKHVHALLKYKQQLIFDSIENLVKVDDSDKESNEPLFVEESEEEWRQRFDSANDKVNSRDKSKHAWLIDNILEGQRRRGKGPERELTPEFKETLLQAHQYMLSVCDGALEDDGMGFSKPDAGTARIISLNFNDERSMRALERLLSRYHRQLSGKFPALFETIE